MLLHRPTARRTVLISISATWVLIWFLTPKLSLDRPDDEALAAIRGKYICYVAGSQVDCGVHYFDGDCTNYECSPISEDDPQDFVCDTQDVENDYQQNGYGPPNQATSGNTGANTNTDYCWIIQNCNDHVFSSTDCEPQGMGQNPVCVDDGDPSYDGGYTNYTMNGIQCPPP